MARNRELQFATAIEIIIRKHRRYQASSIAIYLSGTQN
jgi:hypothetical protein